jgi:glycosyltransferase involved in cell wall biosynthesis
VTMFVFSPFAFDSRVTREVRALVGAGYTVTLLASRAPGLPATEEVDGARVVRVPGSVRETAAVRGLMNLAVRRGDSKRDANVRPVEANDRRQGLRALLRRLILRVGAIASWRLFAHHARLAGADNPADVWYAHDLDTLPIAAGLRRRLGGRLVYDSHELFVETVLDPPRLALERRWWRRTERRLISEADQVFVDIPSRGALLSQWYGISDPEVIMNVPPYMPPPDRNPALRDQLGGGLETILLYVGGISRGRRRGLATVVRALLNLPDTAGLVLIGPTESEVEVELGNLAAALGVGDRLRIHPPVHPDELREWIAQADIGLVPFLNLGLNNYLSLPTKLFDYLSAGIPVAVSDFPDLKRLVTRHDVGVVFDPEVPSSIATTCMALLRDTDRLRRLRKNAGLAAKQYRWEDQERSLVEAIDGLVGRRANRHQG